MKPYYSHAGITIYNADCREVLPTLPKVDLICTDPPYGLGKKMQGGTWGAQDHNSGFLVWDLEAPAWFPELIKGGQRDCMGRELFALASVALLASLEQA